MSTASEIFDQQLLLRRRQQRAVSLADHDFLPARVADDFADRLQLINRRFPVALDFEAGSGRVGRALLASGKVDRLISSDSAIQVAARLPLPRVASELTRLPFADTRFDLVATALALQLVDDLPGVLLQIRRCLKPDGLFLGAVLAGDTLHELRQAFGEAESEITGGVSPRVAPFAAVRDLGALLQRAGFALPVADSDVLTVTYQSPAALIAELRAAGAANPLVARSRVPLRRAVLERALAIYQRDFSLAGGRVQATFEIVTLTGWAPHESQQRPLRPGSARSSLAEALKRR